MLDTGWPDGVAPGGQNLISSDPRVRGVTLRVGAGFAGHEIGDLRAEHAGRQVRVGWSAGLRWTDHVQPLAAAGVVVAAAAELDEPKQAVAFAFDALLAQLHREVAHLVWLDDAGVTIHHCCLHVDEGTCGWSSDFEHHPFPPRRPPD